MRGYLRSLVGAYRIKNGIGIRRADGAEGGHRSPKESTGLLHRDQRVLKGRRRGIVCNRLYLSKFLGHASLDGRLIVPVLDFVEGRSLERQGTRSIKRIRGAELHLGSPGRPADDAPCDDNRQNKYDSVIPHNSP